MRGHFSGMRYGDLKKQVAEMVIANLEPLQKRYAEIMDEPGYLTGVLEGRRGTRIAYREIHRSIGEGADGPLRGRLT